MQQAAQIESTESCSTVDEVVLVAVDPQGFGLVWPLAKALLRPAYDRTPKGDVANAWLKLMNGDYMLWLVWCPGHQEALAAWLTEIAIYPTGWKSVRIIAAGGHEMRRWVHLVATIEEFARDEGCDAVEILGRPGWAKVFSKYGYGETTRVLGKVMA